MVKKAHTNFVKMYVKGRRDFGSMREFYYLNYTGRKLEGYPTAAIRSIVALVPQLFYFVHLGVPNNYQVSK